MQKNSQTHSIFNFMQTRVGFQINPTSSYRITQFWWNYNRAILFSVSPVALRQEDAYLWLHSLHLFASIWNINAVCSASSASCQLIPLAFDLPTQLLYRLLVSGVSLIIRRQKEVRHLNFTLFMRAEALWCWMAQGYNSFELSANFLREHHCSMHSFMMRV